MEILTHSKRTLFRACRRAYFYRHELRLVPRIERAPKRRGTAFGLGLQAAILHERQEDPNPSDGDYMDAAARAIADYYDEQHPSSTAEEMDLQVEQGITEQLCFRYLANYGVSGRREVEFDRPLVNPDTGMPSRTFQLGGKIDGLVVIGPKHARLIEDKLVVQITKSRIDQLPLDEQTTEYVDALASKGWTGEVEYRWTRWPSIKVRQGDTVDDFLARFAADLRERHDFYFFSEPLLFPTEQLEEHRIERWQVAKDLMECRRSARWYRNPSRCDMFGGGCQYPALCLGRPDAMDLYRVEERDNPELELTQG